MAHSQAEVPSLQRPQCGASFSAEIRLRGDEDKLREAPAAAVPPAIAEGSGASEGVNSGLTSTAGAELLVLGAAMAATVVGADKKGGKRRLAPAVMLGLLGASLLASCAPVGTQTVEPGVTIVQPVQATEVQGAVIVPTEEPTETPTEVPTETPEPTQEPTVEPTATPAPTETPTPTEVPIPTEVTQLLQGTGFEAVSVGVVTQQNGEAQAYFDEAGDMVAVVNLSTGELERTKFDVNGTEVYVFPNTRTTSIRTEGEAISHLSGKSIGLEDFSNYDSRDGVYYGWVEMAPISITQVDMEEWRIVQPDADQYTFPVARIYFNYSDKGVVKRGVFYMRNTAVYKGRLDREITSISREGWSRITMMALHFLPNESDLQRIESAFHAMELGPYYGETSIAAWSALEAGNIDELRSIVSGEELTLGEPGSPFIPMGLRDFK